MGYISGSGTVCAAPIGGSGRSRSPRRAHIVAGAAAAMLLLPGAAPVATLKLSIDQLRSHKGMLRVCLTADPKNFPGCVDDTHALTRSVPASETAIAIDGLPHGDYAAAIIHDENSNNKLYTFMGIPREGFGFSRNPPIHFGPPRFTAARFTITGDREDQDIKMRYLL